jgi:NAD dependent epimerase/dehydratase family enzyme
MIGEMADALLLASRRIEPKKLLDNGYQFRFPALEDALRHELAGSG